MPSRGFHIPAKGRTSNSIFTNGQCLSFEPRRIHRQLVSAALFRIVANCLISATLSRQSMCWLSERVTAVGSILAGKFGSGGA
jgi:hypothetical protein